MEETQKWLQAQLDAARDLVNTGSQALRQGNVPAAGDVLGEANAILDMCEETTDDEVLKLRARVLNELGVVNQRQNKLEAAERFHGEAAKLCDALIGQGAEFRGNGAATHLNLASIQAALGRLEPARQSAERSLELIGSLQESGEPGTEMLAMGTHQNLAVIAAREGRIDEADEHMSKALEWAMTVAEQGHPNVRAQAAQGCQQVSVIFFEAEAYDQALKWGRKAEELSEKAFEDLGQPVLPVYVISQINLISYYEKLGQFADAEDCLWKAVDVAGNDPQILRRGQIFYEMCRKQADPRLEAGNLPREEVEEGYADLMERIESIGGLPEPPKGSA